MRDKRKEDDFSFLCRFVSSFSPDLLLYLLYCPVRGPQRKNFFLFDFPILLN